MRGGIRGSRRTLLCLALAGLPFAASAQTQPAPDWRHVGSYTVQLRLADPATGPADRVWYSPGGEQLLVRTRSGASFATSDFEHWERTDAVPPPQRTATPVRLPETDSRTLASPGRPTEQFAVGDALYRSSDGGANWNNLTGRVPILGRGLSDTAVSPSNSDEIVVAGSCGVFRSVDAGLTWKGLNAALPNLPVIALRRGSSSRGVQVVLQGMATDGLASTAPLLAEWAPGQRDSWQPVPDRSWAADEDRKRTLSQQLGVPISVLVASGDVAYAGSTEGLLNVSRDGGRTWRGWYPTGSGTSLTGIYIDTKDPQVALATLSAKSPAAVRTRVLQTNNGGSNWLDITGNLPDANLHGIAADRETGAIYVAGDGGVFLLYTDLVSPTQSGIWTQLNAKLPAAPVLDVKLDPTGNQLYAAVAGFGVYATLAPHRWRDPRIVSAASDSIRATAPGSLLSILGSSASTVRLSGEPVSVLSAADQHVEFQVPFEAKGNSLPVAFDAQNGRVSLGVPLQKTAPAIYTDRNGGPLLLDADTGSFLDGANPAHPGMHVQVLMTGLGRVSPDWPTGTAAPLENVPSVLAPVKAMLDRQALEVVRATLAPGYVGMYLVEVILPSTIDSGLAELSVEADGQVSNRVRLFVENN